MERAARRRALAAGVGDLLKVKKIATSPYPSPVPELPDTGFREVIVGNYRVIYRVVGNTVEILTVMHGRRKVG
jgi:plasmid stabilization system protein ParE